MQLSAVGITGEGDGVAGRDFVKQIRIMDKGDNCRADRNDV